MFLLTNNVIAAPIGISASKTNVEAGESFTITVSSDYIGRIDVSATGGKVEFANGKNKVWVEKGSDTITVTAKEAGTYTFTATPSALSNGTDDITGIEAKSTTVNVKDNSSTKQETVNVNQNTTNNISNTSANTNTKATTTQEPTFSNSNKTMYATGDINVRSSYSASSSIAGSLKKGDAVTVVGIGSNGWSKVTYNGKTAYIKTDLLTSTKPEEDKPKNAKLNSLKIEGVNLEPEFNPETLDYKANVGKDVTSLKIDAKAEDEKAKITIEGNEKLKAGENTVKISVTTEDGAVTTYLIVVTKSESETLGLASLKIDGINLNEGFKTDKYEYTVDLKGKEYLTKLNITAKANKEKATVEIIGNDNLQIG